MMDHSLFIPFAILFYVVAFLIIRKFWRNWIADRIEEISVFWLTVIYVIVIPLSLLPLRICYDFIFEWLLGK